MNPSRERKIAARDAIDEYFAFKTYGSPEEGGTDNQPAEWVESIAATSSAAKKVENLIEKEMNEEREKKMKEKQKKAKSGKKRR